MGADALAHGVDGPQWEQTLWLTGVGSMEGGLGCCVCQCMQTAHAHACSLTLHSTIPASVHSFGPAVLGSIERRPPCLQALATRASKPLVVVLVHNGPIDVSELQASPRVAAILSAWLVDVAALTNSIVEALLRQHTRKALGPPL